jgi:MFS family permease
LAVSAIFGVIFSPLIGRLIDVAGYKFVMVTDTLLLIVVCFFYGFSHRIFPPDIAFGVVCINYILDAIISLASMASSIYVKDIADNDEEVTATLSTGVSVNHVFSDFHRACRRLDLVHNRYRGSFCHVCVSRIMQ